MALLASTASHGRGFGAISIAFSMEQMYGDGLNLYQYLGSNPWTNADPLGLSRDPWADIDAIIDEHIGSIAAFASALGADAAATAVMAARIASYLPFPGVSIIGDLALYAMGEQSGGQLATALALGIIPGGKIAGRLFKGLGKLSTSAFKSASGYAAMGAGVLASKGRGLFAKAKSLLRRKDSVKGACGCFTAMTLVWTANGAMPIGEIEEGQQVFAAADDGLSEDYSSNEVATKIIVGEASLVQLVVLHEDGLSEVINTTDEHPFHVADTASWTRADQLLIGDELSTITGTAKLEGVLYTTERVPVYNLSIPGSPTYYVGERGVWVHNCIINFSSFASSAKMPTDKLGYLLGEASDKSKAGWFTKSLGFNGSQKNLLAQSIRDGLANGRQVGEEITQYGTKMRVAQDIMGANGRVMKFTTVWMYKKGSSVPELITVVK